LFVGRASSPSVLPEQRADEGVRTTERTLRLTNREIVDEVLNGRIMADLTYENFEIFCNEVIDKHKNTKGITYCENCHKIVDDRRW
jgi:hypothetical protein